MSLTTQITPLGFFKFKHRRPWPGQRGEAGFDRPFPGEGVAGGEGKQEWELKESKAHLWVLGIEARGGRRWGVDGERRLAGPEHGGGVAPVRFGRGEAV